MSDTSSNDHTYKPLGVHLLGHNRLTFNCPGLHQQQGKTWQWASDRRNAGQWAPPQSWSRLLQSRSWTFGWDFRGVLCTTTKWEVWSKWVCRICDAHCWMPNKLVEQSLWEKLYLPCLMSSPNLAGFVSFLVRMSSDGLTEHNSLQGKTGDCVQRCFFDNPFPNWSFCGTGSIITHIFQWRRLFKRENTWTHFHILPGREL